MAIRRVEIVIHPSPDEHRSTGFNPCCLVLRRLLRLLHHGCIWFLVEDPWVNVRCVAASGLIALVVNTFRQSFSQWIDPKPNDLRTLCRKRLNGVAVLSWKVLMLKRRRIIRFSRNRFLVVLLAVDELSNHHGTCGSTSLFCGGKLSGA